MALLPNEHERNIAFSASIQMALQQDDTRLWQFSATHEGEDTTDGSAFDEMAAFGRPAVVTNPHAYNPIVISELQFTRRWLRARMWKDHKHWPSVTDTVNLSDPTNPVIQYFRASFNTEKDRYWIEQYFGPTQRGMLAPAGDTDITWPAAQTIAVDVLGPGVTPAATGMNRWKINEAFALFLRNEATKYNTGSPQIHIAVSSKQFLNLLNDDTLNDRMSILGQFTAQGWINYIGIMFHHSENLPVTVSGSHRRCPVWMAEGIKIKTAKEPSPRLTQLDGIELHPWQATVNMKIAAARANEKLCAEILCDE